MTLEEFVSQKTHRAIHIEHPEFNTLYVRHASHVLNDKIVETFDIANVCATTPGSGAFKRLIEHLTLLKIGKPLYVESVMNKRFADWLVKNDFTPCGYGLGYDCYYKFLNEEA